MTPRQSPTDTGRRCRPRALPDDGPRPSDQLAAFFLAGIAFLLAGAVSGIAWAVTGDDHLHWLALHLALLGGVSQLVLGAGQFFTCAFLATAPPSRRFAAAEIATWCAGTVLVGIGVPTGRSSLVDVGAALIAAGLVLFAVALRTMQRRSLQQARWAVRWYQACAAFLGIGALVGVALARGAAWTHGSLLGAHLSLNLAGWMGTAIVGTLHTFFPSLTRTQLRHPRLQGPTFVAWVSGVALLATGAAWASVTLLACGWLALLVAALMLASNIVGSLRGAPVLTLPARLVALGQACLPAGLLLALATTVADGVYAPLAGAPAAPWPSCCWRLDRPDGGRLAAAPAGRAGPRSPAIRHAAHAASGDRPLCSPRRAWASPPSRSPTPTEPPGSTRPSILVPAVAAILAARIATLLWQAVAPRRPARPDAG